MESFNATFRACICREFNCVASQAYIMVGTQIEYKSFMETSSEGLLWTFRTVLAAERNFIRGPRWEVEKLFPEVMVTPRYLYSQTKSKGLLYIVKFGLKCALPNCITFDFDGLYERQMQALNVALIDSIRRILLIIDGKVSVSSDSLWVIHQWPTFAFIVEQRF